MTRTEKKYEKKIASLVAKYSKATTETEKSMLCAEANSVKSDCAKDLMKGKVDNATYKRLFKIGEVSWFKHFLDVWAEEKK